MSGSSVNVIYVYDSKDSVPLAIFQRHSWTHPEGWRDWPDETPATPVAVTDGKVPIPERCVAGFPPAARWPARHEGKPNGCFSAHLSRMRRRLPTRGALRLPSLLRAAGGQVRKRPPEGRSARA